MDLSHLEQQAALDADAMVMAIRGELEKLWTALPAIVDGGSNGHTVTIQPAIKATITAPDGTKTTVSMPLLQDVPVHFAGGGGVTATHPVADGDEGVVVFTARNQDAWHQNGGVQSPVDARRHHLADARYIPGGRSDPRKLDPAPSTSSHQIRSDDGNHVVDVHPSNGVTTASTKKALTSVGGSNGSGTLHTSGSIFKNAARVLINCVKTAGLPDPGVTLANNQAVATQPPPAIGPLASTIASVMTSVLSSGRGAIFSDPTATANSALSGIVSSGATALASALGGSAGSITAALTGSGGLASSLSTLATLTSAMSGATAPAAGSFGLSDVLAHATALDQYFGSSVPASVSLATVLAPLQSASTLTAMQTQLSSIVASVSAGSTTVAAGTTAVAALTAQINALVQSANAALTTLETALPALSLAAAAGAAGIGQSASMQTVAAAIGNSSLSSLTSAMSAIVSPTSDEAAAAAAFPDASATSAGATGGL